MKRRAWDAKGETSPIQVSNMQFLPHLPGQILLRKPPF